MVPLFFCIGTNEIYYNDLVIYLVFMCVGNRKILSTECGKQRLAKQSSSHTISYSFFCVAATDTHQRSKTCPVCWGCQKWSSIWESSGPGSHSHTKVERMLVIKNVVKESSFGLVASSTFLEKRVLFRFSYDI